MTLELTLDPIRTSPTGKLAVLTPGMGAVATTFFAGVEAIKRKLALPIGSYTQMGQLDLRGSAMRSVKDQLPFASLNDLVFGGWDLYPDSAYEAAQNARVLEPALLEQLKKPLREIRPMPAVFDPAFIRKLSGQNVKSGQNKMDLAEQLRQDIRNFIRSNGCDRAVMVWCASTEAFTPFGEVHQSIEAFEQGLKSNHSAISPSQIYTYAAIQEGVPYVNGSPSPSVEAPALQQLAESRHVPIAGSDFKTGQTLLKTTIGPALRNRLLGVSGWYSTNILGNRDGEVLDDPDSFKSKEISKKGVLTDILSSEKYPELYGEIHHVVRIQYYPPRGDNKEGWDNIDLYGWLGYPMQLKINFLCRDSILAAPLVLDLALFMDLSHRLGHRGIQDWLSFFFKAPLVNGNQSPVHDLFEQFSKLENQMRHWTRE